MPTEHSIPEDTFRRTLIIIIVAVFAAGLLAGVFVLLGGFAYLFKGGPGSGTLARLENAVRPGSADWEKYSKLIARDEPEADEAKRALGDTVMTLHTTLRNFTGRTIVGLEVRAAVVDHDGKAVKERTVVVIPGRQSELEPNKTMKVNVMLEGFTDTDDRADIKMEVVGFKLK